MQLIIAEKPSVARDLARVLRVTSKGDGVFRNDRIAITWCLGHLVELKEPEEYDESWKRWSLATLPMLPNELSVKPVRKTFAQWKVVRELLRDRAFREVINACDAGREGELIFRYVYELSGSRLPVRRLWISSLTDRAIEAGFRTLRDGKEFDPLAAAARCRAESDWIVGLNATRAITVKYRSRTGALMSVGRVQTPTLAMVVEREEAIRSFVPKAYHEVKGTFLSEKKASIEGLYTFDKRTRLSSRVHAEQLVARCEQAQRRYVQSVERTEVKEPPPLLFDLTSLQRTANRRFGFTAQRTLTIAQALYEHHKVITYPRTDSRFLSQDVRREVNEIFNALAVHAAYSPFVKHATAREWGALGRVFNNARVSDHHAIIPTTTARKSLSGDEAKLFDLIARRFIAAFYEDARFAQTVIRMVVGEGTPAKETAKEQKKEHAKAPVKEDSPENEDVRMLDALPAAPDVFVARGRVRLDAGWQTVMGIEASEDAQPLLPDITQGELLLRASYDIADKMTPPPERFTEATLLSAMEYAGRTMDDEALKQAMKDNGLGTPATRASMIETLIERKYLEREKKTLVPTPLGMTLLETIPTQDLRSARLTGDWEARLARIARGEDSRDKFMTDIRQFVRALVDQVRSANVLDVSAPPPQDEVSLGPCPKCQGPIVEKFKTYACAKCTYHFYKEMARRALSPALVQVLLSKKITQKLKGFRSKAGKSFEAAIELAQDGALRFVFENRDRTGTEAPSQTVRSKPRSKARAPRLEQLVPLAPPSTAASAENHVEHAKHEISSNTPKLVPIQVNGKAPADVSFACPQCANGKLIRGRQAWGCSEWRHGCTFVVPFAMAGKSITETQLRDLLEKGKSRKSSYEIDGQSVKGRLLMQRDGNRLWVSFAAEDE